MLSLVGDNMLDPNIAAEEGQVYILRFFWHHLLPLLFK